MQEKFRVSGQKGLRTLLKETEQRETGPGCREPPTHLHPASGQQRDGCEERDRKRQPQRPAKWKQRDSEPK